MRVDLRILGVVSCFMVIAASAVIVVRHPAKDDVSSMFEKLPAMNVPTAERGLAGLQFQVNSKGMLLVLPSCDTKESHDKFFLHLYTDAESSSPDTKFVNRDFDLSKEKWQEIDSNGIKKCVFIRSFDDATVKEVIVGQFTTPNGQCCNVTWSRSFVFDPSLRKKQ